MSVSSREARATDCVCVCVSVCSASTGDVVVALEDGSAQRALVCGTGPNGYR